MQAFHNDPLIKAQYIARVRSHREAERLIKGVGWDNGRGCAVGCTLEAYDHARYPIELGIPEALARLEDAVFERLPENEWPLWPEKFLDAIPVGAELEFIQWQFLHWLLTDSGLLIDGGQEDVRKAIDGSAALMAKMARGESVEKRAARAAEIAAWGASAANDAAARAAEIAAWGASAANDAAALAARSAASSVTSSAAFATNAALAARYAAKSAARSAVWGAASVGSAAWSAAWGAASVGSAAWSAAWGAASVGSAAKSAVWGAASVGSAAKSAAWMLMADKLLELLRKAT